VRIPSVSPGHWRSHRRRAGLPGRCGTWPRRVAGPGRGRLREAPGWQTRGLCPQGRPSQASRSQPDGAPLPRETANHGPARGRSCLSDAQARGVTRPPLYWEEANSPAPQPACQPLPPWRPWPSLNWPFPGSPPPVASRPGQPVPETVRNGVPHRRYRDDRHHDHRARLRQQRPDRLRPGSPPGCREQSQGCDHDLKDAEPDTLRYRLWALPARLARHARQRVLKLSRTWPWKEAFLTCWQRLCALPEPA
jgi:hypothetical protein